MGVRGFVEFYGGSGDFLKERPKKVALILADRVYGFYFLIEKRIILFKKSITFFTIKIFQNLDNQNLNFFMTQGLVRYVSTSAETKKIKKKYFFFFWKKKCSFESALFLFPRS